MDAKTYIIKTFGCQMNEHDTQKIGGVLGGLGFEPARFEEEADFILFNTCTVREKAHQKAFSAIGRTVAKKRPISLIAVCGCMAQEEGAKLLSRFPEIDIIFGPDQIYRLPELLKTRNETGRPAIATELINSQEDYHFLDSVPAMRFHGPTAYVTIMKGCNSHCSYCIVPKVRGTEVYRPWRDIVREVQYLVEKGCREVTLLGQNVNSYGTGAEDGVRFGKLIRLISDNTDVERIRFTSPHPKDVDCDLIEEYATNPKLCSHIHLPLQSGSDMVLRRMRRAYNRKTYRAKIEKLRKVRPSIAISTDMIVGFCGETEAEFQSTLDFLQEIRFDYIYAFKYSPRPDTEAHQFPDDVPPGVKEKRLSELFTLQAKISHEINQSYVGRTEAVLVEGEDKLGKGRSQGRTETNKIANFSGNDVPIGVIVNVEIKKANANSLEGILCQKSR